MNALWAGNQILFAGRWLAGLIPAFLRCPDQSVHLKEIFLACYLLSWGFTAFGQADSDTVSIFAYPSATVENLHNDARFKQLLESVPNPDAGVKSMLSRRFPRGNSSEVAVLFELYEDTDVSGAVDWLSADKLFDSLRYNTYEEIYGQPYVPFVVDSANWIQLQGADYLHFHLAGDTLLGDTTYKKMYVAPYYPGQSAPWDMQAPYAVGPPSLLALLREDTTERKVYGRLSDYIRPDPEALSEELLIHDFSARPLDTVFGLFGLPDGVVRGRTRLDTFGRDRSVFWFDNGIAMEGVGSPIFGPLRVTGYFTQEGYHSLIAYCVGSFSVCGIDRTTSTGEVPSTLPLLIYPNPAVGDIFIDHPPFPAGQEIRVGLFDAWGRQLSDEEFRSGPISIPISHLPNGIYTVRLTGRGWVAAGQFIR
ncbi:putative secreted protein (Por secretion system target) [Neolewinella xylanilytica]|uniref:Putative secreted protein (Por secretion system target) n=1 Tax=Neolewinella xylanilytica TaxID=1514080 RepID=A0A2S6I1M7_9BACT|nr:T9SS type A sorting domain-containing protein [Neolewinella xylanilytica]PPK85086.1 putative secreted protein (Por secretion system target) [Neolewinella xylanilytica]